MIPKTLSDYLVTCKGKGLSYDLVVGELKKAGWQDDVIEEGRIWFGGTAKTTVFPAAVLNIPVSTPTSSVLPVIPPIVQNQTPAAEPVIFTSPSEPAAVEKPSVKKRGPVILALFLVLIFFLISAVGTFAYFVAAEKININNDNLKKTISKAVFSIPFIPKTPKYVLELAIAAHKKVSRNSFDFSLATSSESFTSILGSSQMDIQIKGYTDYSDIKQPKGYFNFSLTKELNFDAKLINKMVYLKVNKIPLVVYTMLKIDPQQVSPLLENWISYDMTPMETKARKSLEGSSLSQAPSEVDKKIIELVSKIGKEDILPALKMSSDKVDSFATYKIELVMTPQLMDKIQTEAEKQYPQTSSSGLNKKYKASDIIKNTVFNFWIDQKDYYMRKGTLVFTYDIPGDFTTGSSLIPFEAPKPAQVSIAFVFSDFGKEIPVEPPVNSITPEVFYQRFVNVTGWGTPGATSSGEATPSGTLGINTFFLKAY